MLKNTGCQQVLRAKHLLTSASSPQARHIYIYSHLHIYIHTCSHFGSSKMGSGCTCSRRAATELPVIGRHYLTPLPDVWEYIWPKLRSYPVPTPLPAVRLEDPENYPFQRMMQSIALTVKCGLMVPLNGRITRSVRDTRKRRGAKRSYKSREKREILNLPKQQQMDPPQVLPVYPLRNKMKSSRFQA